MNHLNNPLITVREGIKRTHTIVIPLDLSTYWPKLRNPIDKYDIDLTFRC